MRLQTYTVAGNEKSAAYMKNDIEILLEKEKQIFKKNITTWSGRLTVHIYHIDWRPRGWGGNSWVFPHGHYSTIHDIVFRALF